MIIDRRRTLAVLACLLAAPAAAQTPGMSRMTASAFSFAALDGGDIRLSAYAGKPILVVNTASQCGYTPQYAGLQELWTRYRERGLMIIAVPSNDFGGQEPGGASEIHATANHVYGITFPLAEKAVVKRREPAPVLQMGRERAPARRAALELPQVPDRPRRPHRGGVPVRRRADRSAPDRGDREAARRVGCRSSRARPNDSAACRVGPSRTGLDPPTIAHTRWRRSRTLRPSFPRCRARGSACPDRRAPPRRGRAPPRTSGRPCR